MALHPRNQLLQVEQRINPLWQQQSVVALLSSFPFKGKRSTKFKPAVVQQRTALITVTLSDRPYIYPEQQDAFAGMMNHYLISFTL